MRVREKWVFSGLSWVNPFSIQGGGIYIAEEKAGGDCAPVTKRREETDAHGEDLGRGEGMEKRQLCQFGKAESGDSQTKSETGCSAR